MGALDRLANYRMSDNHGTKKVADSGKFDLNTPLGCFLNLVHTSGFDLFKISYKLSDETKPDDFITAEEYDTLADSEKPLWKKVVTYTELYDVLMTEGNLVINAAAGSGKTSTLVFKIIHDIITGECMTVRQLPNTQTKIPSVNNVWVCTFLRSGAEELQTTLLQWQRRFGYTPTGNQINFSTLDAEFKRCLNAMGISTNIGDAGKLNSLLKKAIDSCNVKRDGSPLTKEDYQIIGSIITYYRGRLDEKRYQHPSCADYGLTKTILELIVKQFETMRKSEGIVDFDEIQELLYRYLYVTPNKAVQDFVANRYNFMYIDEFQDTSQMQYAILKFYARGKLWLNNLPTPPEDETDAKLYTGVQTLGKVVGVGDINQCIYSFKGSDSKILSVMFDKDFRPSVCALSCNYRCPANILNPVIPSIHKNEDGKNQLIVPYKDGGIFNVYSFNTFKQMVRQLEDDILNDVEQNHYSVTILCRTNFDGMIPAFVLEAQHKVKFSISGENMTLDSPLSKKLLAITSLFTEKSTGAVKNSLQMFVAREDVYHLGKMMETLKMNNKSIFDIPIADIDYSVPSLVGFVKEVRKILMPEGTRLRERELDALRYVYMLLIATTFKGTSAYCTSARAYIETLLFVIDSHNFETIYDFISEIDFLGERLRGRINSKTATVKIATVHEYKGKECDSVYIWNDSVGVFPSNKCNMEDEEQLAEERRVHYIACTRAREKSTIYTLAGKSGMFLREMDCTVSNASVISTTLQKQVV